MATCNCSARFSSSTMNGGDPGDHSSKCATRTANKPLADAIECLGAVEVSQGANHTRYAFAYGYDKRWYVVGEASLCVIAASKKRQEALHSTLEAIARRMPAWWSPERRFAWRDDETGRVIREHKDGEAVANFEALDRVAQRITVDLETGAEVTV